MNFIFFKQKLSQMTKTKDGSKEIVLSMDRSQES